MPTKAEVSKFVEALEATLALAEYGAKVRAILSGDSKWDGKPRLGKYLKPAKVAKRVPGMNPGVVLGALKNARKNGASVGGLARTTHESVPRVAAALKKLRAAKKAKMVGKKRFARWFAI